MMTLKRLGMRLFKLFLYFFGAGLLCFLLQEFYLLALLAPFDEFWGRFNFDVETLIYLIGNLIGFLIHAAFMIRYVRGVAIDDIQIRKYHPGMFNSEYAFSLLFTFAPLAISMAVPVNAKPIFVFFYAPFLALRDFVYGEYFLAALPFFALEALLVFWAYSFFGKRYIRAFEKEHGSCVYYEE